MKTTLRTNAVVTQCYHGCPFFTVEGMEHMMLCEHPYWRDKGAYAGAIITQDNSRGRVPDACPLKHGLTETTQRVRLERK